MRYSRRLWCWLCWHSIPFLILHCDGFKFGDGFGGNRLFRGSKFVRSALTSSGYYKIVPKGPEDVTPTKVKEAEQAIHRAREQFPFDLTQIILDGKRPGYDDEWIVTAETTADKLRHSDVRSMVLMFMLDPKLLLTNVFLVMTERIFSGKTVSTNLDLTGIGSIAYKLRAVLRYFQEFPKELASY
jgi:hypothetical protein